MTLLGIKFSTKDIDLLVPEEKEHAYLIDILQDLGYKPAKGPGWRKDDGFIFDLFRGKQIHTTELLESPLKEGNHIVLKEFSHIYLGALNYYDLIISKLFRGARVDMDDCLSLVKVKKREIDMDLLEKKFKETALYDVSQDKVNKNLEYFLKRLKREGIYEE